MKQHKISTRLRRLYATLLGTCFVGGALLILISPPTEPIRQQPPDTLAQTSEIDQPAAVNGIDIEDAATTATTSPAAADSSPVSPQTQSAQPQPTPGTTSSPAEPPTPIPDPPPETIQASLLVNGTHKGEVTAAPGNNHCDLLSQALASGVISSLEMRYSTQHKSHGVYIIDGLGDRDTVWWTYEVNNRPPPLGCSHITVNHGDTVHWKYQRR